MSGSIKMWVLAFVVAAASGFGLLVGIGCALNANSCPFTKKKPFTSTEGREVWLHSCAVCHGIDAKGRNGPSLVSGDGGALTLDAIRSKVDRGRPFMGMPRFRGDLSPAQIEAVARFILTLREAS